MFALLAAGTFALAFVAGDAFVDGVGVRKIVALGVSSIALATAIGTVLLTPVLVLLAFASAFHPAAIGTLGWVALAAWLALRRRSRFRLEDARSTYVVVAAAVAFAVVAAGGRDDPFGAGRDQQVYATFGTALAHTHSARAVTLARDDADAALLRAVGADRDVDRYLGIRRSVDAQGTLESQSYLPLGFTVWLAIAAAIGGLAAVAVANVGFFAVGALLFERALRPLAGSTIAAGGAVALLALPTSLWIAGVTLSEPLAMLGWIAMLALVAQGRALAPFALGVLVFACGAIRIDALPLAPLVAVAAVVHAVATGGDEPRKRAQRVAVAMLVAVVAGGAWHGAWDRAYFVVNAREALAVGLVAAALVVVASLPATAYARVQRILASRRVFVFVSVLIVGALMYAALVRPTLAPFALIHNGTGLDGSRDFREDSLGNLAMYVGWPIVVLATVGVLTMWRRVTSGTASALGCLLLIVGVGMSALYLAAPLVSPDHPWAMRRFVPVVLPCVLAFAALALATIADRFSMLPRFASAALLAALSLGATAAQGPTLFATRANEGVTQALLDIGSKLPGTLTVCDAALANICGPLAIAFGHPIVVANLADPDVHAAVGRWFDAKARLGEPAWLLHAPSTSLAGALSTCTGQWRFVRHFVAPTTRPPARSVGSEKTEVELSRIDALDSRFAEQSFGATPVFGVVDRGFYRQEATPFGTVRMTDGRATLELPASALAPFRALAFDWFSWAPRGERRTTRVTIDGREAWRADLSSGVSSSIVPLAAPNGAVVRIGIESDAFDPRVLDASDSRTRVGIGLLGIRPQQ